MVNNPEELSGLDPQLGSRHGQDVDDQLSGYEPQLGGDRRVDGHKLPDVQNTLNESILEFATRTIDMNRAFDDLNTRIGDLSRSARSDGHSGIIDRPTQFLTSTVRGREHVEITPVRNRVRRDHDGRPISSRHGRPLTRTSNRELIEYDRNDLGLSDGRITIDSVDEAMVEIKESINSVISSNFMVPLRLFGPYPDMPDMDDFIRDVEETIREALADVPEEVRFDLDGLG